MTTAEILSMGEGALDVAAGPSLDGVTQQTRDRAARVAERCFYQITGFVMAHRALPQKAIVEGKSVRWFPNLPEFVSMMAGKESLGPGTPPAAYGEDEPTVPNSAHVLPAPVATAIESRPVLTAPPTQRLIENAEDALGELARELGCIRNDSIPHNAGWFVPGKPTAYASAFDAIQGLVSSLKNGGTVYGGKPRRADAIVASEPENSPLQGGLF